MAKSIAFLAVGAMSWLMATGAYGHDALYGDQPSRNAVFVRFVNALDTKVSVETDLWPPSKLGTDGKDRIGPYSVIDRSNASSFTMQAKTEDAEISDKIKLEAGTTMSIVLRKDDGKLRIIALSMPSEMTQSRAILSFVNASPSCGAASLMLDPAKATIFANVPVDGERSRRINPVSAQLSAACGDLGVVTAKLERPEAGSAYSVWLLSLNGHPALILGTDSLSTWHP